MASVFRLVLSLGVCASCVCGISPLPARAAVSAVGSGAPKEWSRAYDRLAGDDMATAMAVSPDGTTVFVTGNSASWGGPWAYATVAYNASTGAERWEATYEGPAGGYAVPVAIAVSPDGERVFVTGRSHGPNGYAHWATVAYEAASGTQLWAEGYHGPARGYSVPVAIAVSPDGTTAYVTGDDARGPQQYKLATIAYDAATGTTRWVSRFGARYRITSSRAMALDQTGSRLVVTGVAAGRHLTRSTYLTLSFDAASGALQWSARYAGRGLEWDASSVAISPDGSRVFVTGAGRSQGYSTVAYEASSGTQEWVARSLKHKGTDDDNPRVAVSPDGTRVFLEAGGAGVAHTSTSPDFAAVALDATTGERLWTKGYDAPDGGNDQPAAIATSTDGALVFLTGSSGNGVEYTTVAYDASDGATRWVRHYDGRVSGVGVATTMAVSPDGARLFVSGFVRAHQDYAEDFGTVAYGLS